MAEAYPLQAARELRERAVEEAQQNLASAIVTLERARAAQAAAEAALLAHEDATRELVAKESASGARPMSDVLRGQAYLERRRREAAALREALADRGREVDAAGASVQDAQSELATARAEHEAVEKHHARWLAERRRKRLAREEEDADERASRG